MSNQVPKIPLALEPSSKPIDRIALMKVLRDHLVFESWVAARDLTMDLEMLSPQVVWVNTAQLESFEAAVSDLKIVTQQVSKAQAEKIASENKPVRGDIKIQIRTRNHDISEEMVNTLKAQVMISHAQSGENANNLYHWKDDRWYQDFYLYAFRESDLPAIESLINGYYFFVVGVESIKH